MRAGTIKCECTLPGLIKIKALAGLEPRTRPDPLTDKLGS